MDRQEFGQIFAGLSAVFEKIPQNQACMNVWFKALEDLDYKAVSAAATRYIQTEHYAPKPADIRELVLSARGALDDAGRSFEIAMDAVRRFGYARSGAAQKWLDENYPLTGAVVERLGFASICDSPVESRGVLRGQYFKIYQELAEKVKKNAMTSPAVRAQIGKEAAPELEEHDEG